MGLHDDDDHRWSDSDRFDAYVSEQVESAVESAIEELTGENIRAYLETYGDSIQQRVDACIGEAQSLSDKNFHGAATLRAMSAIEVIFRYMLIRPIVQGAFLSDDWAKILTEQIVSSKNSNYRRLLPAIFSRMDVDYEAIRLSTGQAMWNLLENRLWNRRNLIVHEGQSGNDEDASLSIETASLLLSDVVYPIAENLGMDVGKTGKWGGLYSQKQSPFPEE